MKKTSNKWKTGKCGRCGEAHENYTGKLDINGVEYVVCGKTNNRMNVSGEGDDIYNILYSTKWIKM